MKTFALALLSASLSASAFAATDSNIEADCRTRDIYDAGYHLVIKSNPETQKLEAILATISEGGETKVAEMRVERRDISNGDIRVFTGKELKLEVDMNSSKRICRTPPILGGDFSCFDLPFRAKLTSALVSGELMGEMSCVLSEGKLTPPTSSRPRPGQFTCMAYWMGAYFNSDTGNCVQAGASGCSSPFEFNDVKSCEEAYAVRR